MHRLGDPPPKWVAVLRALQLGDLLCAVPAFRALRAALPNTAITLVGLPWAAELVGRFAQYLDGFIEFPGHPGLPEQPAQLERIPAFLADAQRRRFDLAIQMHGNGAVSNSLVVLLGARLNAGYFLPGGYCPDPERFLAYPDHGSEVRRHLRLMEFLGAPARGEHLEFPLRAKDWQALWAVEGTQGLRPGTYACVHPGGRAPSHRWSPEEFAAVADRLAGQGLGVVLTGTAPEAPLARAVARSMRAPAIDLCGRTSLGAVAALLAGARLLVCNDTGVSHLAAALGVPSVVACIESDPERWSPLDRQRHRVVCPRLETDGGGRAMWTETERLLGAAPGNSLTAGSGAGSHT
jgi:ADP-heptose:LPS heptosyltransferase